MIELAPEIFQQSRTIAVSCVPRHFLIAFFFLRSSDASARTLLAYERRRSIVVTPLVTSCLPLSKIDIKKKETIPRP